MKTSRRSLILCLIVVLWTAVVFAGYYAVHKPIVAESFPLIVAELERLSSPWSLGAIFDSALNLGVALWIALVAFGLGRAVVAFILTLSLWERGQGGSQQVERTKGIQPAPSPSGRGQGEGTFLEHLVLSTSLGLGVVSLAVFFLGLAGLLYSWVFYAFFGAIGIAIIIRAIRAFRAGNRGFGRLGGKSWLHELLPDRTDKALALYVVVTELLALLAALAPPWAWDSLVYHLTGPELYLRQHRLIGGTDGMHFYFPALVEMLFMAGMLIKGPIVANLIHWIFGVLAVGAVFCFARRCFGREVAWLASAIFLSVPSIVVLASKAYVDLALILYLTLALWCVMEGFGARGRSWLVLGAAFSGFAMGVKYTGGVGVLALGVAAAVVLLAQGTKNVAALRPVLGCSVLALALAAPWYLKNLAFAGNPFYPFLFGGEFWDSFRAEWVMRAGSGLIGEPWRLLIAPLEATVLGVEGGLGYQATIGPLLLVLLPLLLLVAPEQARLDGRDEGRAWGTSPRAPESFYPLSDKKVVLVCLAFVVVFYLIWLAGIAQSSLLQQTRLLFPVFGVLPALGAYAAYRLRPVAALDLRRVIGGAIGISLLLAAVSQLFLFLADSPLPFIVGAESERQYLSRHLGAYYEAVEFVNARLDEDDKVYLLWEPRSYYFQRDVQPDTILDNWRHLLFLYPDHDAKLGALRSHGYTHVLINVDGLKYFMEEPHKEVEQSELEILIDFEKRHLVLVDGSGLKVAVSSEMGETKPRGNYSIYRLE